MDKGNRQQQAIQRIIHAKQQPGQSVNAFVSYLESLEEDIEQKADSIRRERLLAGLRPHIAKRISESVQQPESRNELIKQACRLESVDKLYHRQDADESHGSRKRTQSPPKSRYLSKRVHLEAGQRTGSTARPSEPTQLEVAKDELANPEPATLPHADRIKNIICYRCQQKEHYASNCWHPVVCKHCKGSHGSKECPRMTSEPSRQGNAYTQLLFERPIDAGSPNRRAHYFDCYSGIRTKE